MKLFFLFISLLIQPLFWMEGLDFDAIFEQQGLVADTNKWVIPTPTFKGDTVYLLLDRNSRNVNYEEYHVNLPNNPNLNYDWSIESALRKSDKWVDGIELVFSCRQRINGVPWAYCQIERKPLSFLDSVTYYNEWWLMHQDRSLLNVVCNMNNLTLILPPKARILDKGTISNDSITMYEVILEWFEEEHDYIEVNPDESSPNERNE